MEVSFLGSAEGGPRLDLDHDRFAYAGKFVMTNTGKAVASRASEQVGAASFNRDRTDETVVWIRYITIRADCRGEGIGSWLLAVTSGHLLEDNELVKIAVNNPFAYRASYKAGFVFTGVRTGLAEVVLARPDERSREAYQRGLDFFLEREDLSSDTRSTLENWRVDDPPPVVTAEPSGTTR